MPKQTALPVDYYIVTYDLRSEMQHFLFEKVKWLEIIDAGLDKFGKAQEYVKDEQREKKEKEAQIQIQHACNELELTITDYDELEDYVNEQLAIYRGTSNIIRCYRNYVPEILRNHKAVSVAQSVFFILQKHYEGAMNELRQRYDEMLARVQAHLQDNGANGLWEKHIYHWDFDKQFVTLTFFSQQTNDTQFLAETFKIQQAESLEEFIQNASDLITKVEDAKTSHQLAGIRKSVNALFEKYTNTVDGDWLQDTEFENNKEKESIAFLMTQLINSVNNHPLNARVLNIEL